MTRSKSILLSLAVLVLAVGYSTRSIGKTRVEDALIEKNYEKAKRLTDEVEDPSEQLFLRGLIVFEQGKFASAQRRFEELVQQYPESSRAEDASYYLDRIKLYSKDVQPPRVRVQLARGQTLSGSITGSVAVRRDSGETLTVLDSGQSWSVKVGYLSSTLTAGEESFALEDGKSIVFTPTRNEVALAHEGSQYRGSLRVKRDDDNFTLVNVLPLDEYLFGVVRKEIAPGWPMETVKAQSVAARSFALSQLDGDTGTFDLRSSHLAQVYGGVKAETKRVRHAVKATRGEVLTYADQVVPAYFHANSGGYLETADSVWNETETPYIVAKPDTWSENTRHARWEATISLRRLRRALTGENYPEPAGDPGLRIESRLESGRSKTLSYRTGYNNRNELSANDLRMAIGPNKLKSTWIESIERSGSTLELSGRGWGHGIGMSQWGAHRMGKRGRSYRKILSFYYERAQLMEQYGLGTRQGEDNTDE